MWITLINNYKIWHVIYESNMYKEKMINHFFDFVEKGQSLSIPLWIDYVFLFYLLFLIGLTGIIFNYKNYLVTMFCIELMYLGITICFIIISVSTADPKGQIYAILLLVLAAAESAIGLGVLIVLYRFGNSIEFQDYQELKG